jgi:hypothetical protein
MSFWAFSGLFQSEGSSAFAFSSSSRRCAVSQSKMPPQQCQRLLDLLGDGLCFCTHLEGLGTKS